VVEKHIPAVSMFSEFVGSGGLMAYGPSMPAAAQRCGAYVGRILQGVKPGELPIERPQTFEWPSTSKLRRPSALRSRHRCWVGRTRFSS